MKKKILYFVLGALVGATITAGIFILIGKGNSSAGMDGNQRPSFENFDGENMPGNMKENQNNNEVENNNSTNLNN